MRAVSLVAATAASLAGAVLAFGASSQSPPILEQMKQRAPSAYAFALSRGAKVKTVQTALGPSFYAVWYPRGKKPQTTPVIVTLHGSRGNALVKFQGWQPEAARRGYGVIALEWWNGVNQPVHGDEAEVNYLSAQQLYGTLRSIFKAEKVKPRLVLLHGHSRGSTRVYPLTFLDRAKRNRYFRLSVADSGPARTENGDIQMITSLTGRHFVLYCGKRDVNPERGSMCDLQATSKTWLESKGAKVDLFIEDPTGNHGGFLASPANINQALDVFARLLRGG
jgi:hypothetical protein